MFGARVLCADARLDAATATAEAIGGDAVHLDLLDPDAPAAVLRDRGAPDVLVTTPAVNVRKRIADYSDDDLDRVVDLNLKGVFRLCRTFGAAMAAAGGGSMIGLSSVRALTTEPGQGAYAATKAATVMLFRTLAAELGGAGVRANVIAPGVVETPLTQPIQDDAGVVRRLRRQTDPASLGAARRARRRRRVPRFRRVELRHRHHAVRRRWLDRRRRPLRAESLTTAELGKVRLTRRSGEVPFQTLTRIFPR